MVDLSKLGPLAALAGAWEGSEGLDSSWSHAEGAVRETLFREQVTFDPLGPVGNGTQVLYGLDYRTLAYREGESDPFHTEIGYWLWDADAGQVMRCFMVPRGETLIAGGDATADASELVMQAELGSTTYGILSNRYLDANARTVRYDLTVRIGDGTWSYEEDTVLQMKGRSELLHHTDRNTLRRA
jgi:hypothetical protein